VVFEWPLRTRGAYRELTAAQREVLGLVLAGQSNAEIARRRGRSPRTIANQVGSIFRRLGVRSRLELFASVTPVARRRRSSR
jgi:DNA-binding CsgD family transcriptional regulator